MDTGSGGTSVSASSLIRGPSAVCFRTILPYDLLARISNRIINEVRGINRVAYGISGKPPATIEWERVNPDITSFRSFI